MKSIIILTILALLLAFLSMQLTLIFKKMKKNMYKLNYNFYDYKMVYPFLDILKENRNLILKDLKKVKNLNWNDWPEKNIYDKKYGWKIFPFKAFDIDIKKNCDLCQNICNILKKLPNLKTALISKVSPNTKIHPHMGWKNLSNNILRCHYVLETNNNCLINVNGEEKKFNNDDIIVFDDSKIHYAENNGLTDKIVLLLDFKRPYYIQKGQSTETDSSDLDKLLDSFRN